MSEQGTIFGCIYGSGPIGSPTAMELYQHNRHTIRALPERVDIANDILIARNLFTVPMPQDGGFYRYQMIHFGQSINHLDDYLESWVNQFETLLRQLYWLQAFAYMNAEIYFGHTEFHWKPHIEPLFEEPPRTIQTWDFSGGPKMMARNREE